MKQLSWPDTSGGAAAWCEIRARRGRRQIAAPNQHCPAAGEVYRHYLLWPSKPSSDAREAFGVPTGQSIVPQLGKTGTFLVDPRHLYQPKLSLTVRKARGSAPGPRWRQGLQTSISLKILIKKVLRML